MYIQEKALEAMHQNVNNDYLWVIFLFFVFPNLSIMNAIFFSIRKNMFVFSFF